MAWHGVGRPCCLLPNRATPCRARHAASYHITAWQVRGLAHHTLSLALAALAVLGWCCSCPNSDACNHDANRCADGGASAPGYHRSR